MRLILSRRLYIVKHAHVKTSTATQPTKYSGPVLSGCKTATAAAAAMSAQVRAPLASRPYCQRLVSFGSVS